MNKLNQDFPFLIILEQTKKIINKQTRKKRKHNPTTTMKNISVLWALGFLILINGKGTWAWGGLFNRFSPEMLSNMGYGSHGGAYRAQPQQLFQVRFCCLLIILYFSQFPLP